MNRPVGKRDSILAIVGIVVGLLVSIWLGLVLVVIAVTLHFAVPEDGDGR